MTSVRRDGVRHGGRIDNGGRRFEDRIAARVDGVVLPDLPWDQVELTPEQAAERSIVGLAEFASEVGRHYGTVHKWRLKYPIGFPQPVCVIRPLPPANLGPSRSGYIADHLHAWLRVAEAKRWVHPRS